jgi:amino acid transporter
MDPGSAAPYNNTYGIEGGCGCVSQLNAFGRGYPKPELSLFDTTSIIVGIIIGAGIYETAPIVAKYSGSPWAMIGAWVLGGVLSLIGALCYAELATSYPYEGGDYVYISRAFGPLIGFLFGWAQMLIIRTGSIAATSYIFADYASRVIPIGSDPSLLYASVLVAALTLINMAGIKEGKWTQNILTTVKVLGITAICVAGFLFHGSGKADVDPVKPSSSFPTAMIFVLWTFGGWNEAAYVAAEVKRPMRNILSSLILGTSLVTVVYLALNVSFLASLGFDGMSSSNAVAADLLKAGLGEWAEKGISLLIAISALGAVNGMIFTGARIYYAIGVDHRGFRTLGRWDERRGTPYVSFAFQGLITLALILLFGSREGFEALVKYTSAACWLFFVLTSISLFLLRRKGERRGFRVPGYPFLPILFLISCLYMLYGSVSYAPLESILGALLIGSGIPIYLISRRWRHDDEE